MVSTPRLPPTTQFLKSYHDPWDPHRKQWKTPLFNLKPKVYIFVLSSLWGFGHKGQYFTWKPLEFSLYSNWWRWKKSCISALEIR
ncbi:unnamed protein product [Blepharisma stoltei]|uniref:Uncharacterized protein n=1 Tax=Blepharisma stoltei TaxID=1481888 RepID=A0AAU9JVR0_9CILI|nr:unnamed protein product [Blepharisma stoltei]